MKPAGTTSRSASASSSNHASAVGRRAIRYRSRANAVQPRAAGAPAARRAVSCKKARVIIG